MTFDFRRSVSLWLVYALGCCALAHHGRAIAQEASSATRPSETQSPRLRMTLNDAWRFVPEDRQEGQDEKCEDSAWEIVDVPHTWNTVDPFDDPPGYRRGGSWYRKRLDLGDSFKGKQLFLYFEGVHQKADVYVNGRIATRHKGGYTAFCCDITPFVRFGTKDRNVIAVRADSGHDESIPPLDIGYAHYGGIYRDVWLIATDPVHFELLDHASAGIRVDTPDVSNDKATLRVRGSVLNESDEPRKVQVVSTLYDAAGKPAGEMNTDLTIAAGGHESFELQTIVSSPHLWSPSSPTLYRVDTVVKEKDTVLDRVGSHCGFRWFKFDSDQGFLLNGEQLALHGASRHQDVQDLGSALPNRVHRTDLEWLKNMGGNFIRLAHYPQDPEVLDTADRLGLIVWEEIPIVSTMSASPEFAAVAQQMLTEMIRQHYNHPAVMMWGYMNEVCLKWGREKESERDPKFPEYVKTLAKELDALARREDPTRATVMAMDGRELYDEVGIAPIPQVAAWNIYAGWYSEGFNNFGKFLDRQHEKYPNRVLFVSEYGAGSDSRLHSLKPRRFDHTAEWQRLYHESHIRQINKRSYLAGVAIWNEFDFSQPEAAETIPHTNEKGMITFDRKPKDIYYLYKANLNTEPLLYIATREWLNREGIASESSDSIAESPIQVYSNCEDVELLVNGRSLGTKKPDDVKSAIWSASMHSGWNVIEAKGHREGKEYRDAVRIHFTCIPAQLSDPNVPFSELAVNVGSDAQFLDAFGLIWLADQPYQSGGFGYIGGKDHWSTLSTVRRLGILGTDEDPLFQTFREQIKSYQFDVPDGDYELELRFTEYFSHEPGERVFRVSCNGSALIDRLDLAESCGVRRANARVFQIHAADGQGVKVDLSPIRGSTILSAIRIRRLL